MKEIYKDIKGYEGHYQVSNLGNVKSLKYGKEKILKNNLNKIGYLFVRLLKNKNIKNYKVHRLVAETFILNKDYKPQVNHIDGNRLNNHINNLEWVTSSENNIHKYQILGYKQKEGKNHHNSIKINQYSLNGEFIKTWDCIMDIQRELNIKYPNIISCCKNKKKTAGGYKFKYNNYK